MNSIMHNSSQFDRGNASTIDGTQMSIQQQFEMRTEVDPLEQQHNCMNLALGKPTQSFRSSMQGAPGALFAGSAAGNHAPPMMFSNSTNKHARQSTMNHDSIISVNSGPGADGAGQPEAKRTVDDTTDPANQIYM